MGFPGRRKVVVLLAGAVALAGCRTSTPSATGPSYEVSTASVGGVGNVLVDGQGFTLYLFEPDHRSASTCYESCAQAWPPVVLPAGVPAPRAGAGVRADLLGTAPRQGGAEQVTYGGWPLYRWVGDTRAGVATGQARNNLGGCWYVLSVDGDAVKSMPCTS